VSFLRHLYPNWAKLNAQSKQIALDLIGELVHRRANIRVYNEEEHLGKFSVFDFVRNTLGEPLTARRLREMVKRRQESERAKREYDQRRSHCESFK
jgi:hypothetical protein